MATNKSATKKVAKKATVKKVATKKTTKLMYAYELFGLTLERFNEINIECNEARNSSKTFAAYAKKIGLVNSGEVAAKAYCYGRDVQRNQGMSELFRGN